MSRVNLSPEFGEQFKKQEYSYSHSSGEWGIATGKTWGDATKESETKSSDCPFIISFKPCKTCPCQCDKRTENFSMI